MIGTLAPALRLQSTIVHALIMQDMNRRAAQSRLGLLVALVEPLFFIALMFAMRLFLHGSRSIHGISLVMFLVTGLLTYFCFRFVVMAVMGAAQRRSAVMMFPQVTTLDTILAQSIGSVIVYAGVLSVAFVAAAIWTGAGPSDYLDVILATFMTLVTGCAIGLVLGCIVRVFPSLRLFMGLVLRVDMFFSGAFFLAAELPSSMIKYVSWNPTFHAIEYMREGWFPGYISPMADLAYVVKLLIALFAIGLSLERITSARIPG